MYFKTKDIHIFNEKVMYDNLLQVFNISVLNKTITMVQTASTTVNSLTQYNSLIKWLKPQLKPQWY